MRVLRHALSPHSLHLRVIFGSGPWAERINKEHFDGHRKVHTRYYDFGELSFLPVAFTGPPTSPTSSLQREETRTQRRAISTLPQLPLHLSTPRPNLSARGVLPLAKPPSYQQSHTTRPLPWYAVTPRLNNMNPTPYLHPWTISCLPDTYAVPPPRQ